MIDQNELKRRAATGGPAPLPSGTQPSALARRPHRLDAQRPGRPGNDRGGGRGGDGGRPVSRAPKVEPPFESLVGREAGPVRSFALRDDQGGMHTMDEWSGRRGIVLLFVACDQDESLEAGRAMARLAALFGPRGFLFLAVCPQPALQSEAAGEFAEGFRAAFPVLFDPAQVVSRQAGVQEVPTVVVLAPDGQVMYRGRVAARGSDVQKRRPRPRTILNRLFERSIATSYPPSSRRRRTVSAGRSAHRPAEGGRDQAEPVTFTRHVAPILWKNCASCHRPGEVGPFSLLTYQDAAKRASFLCEVTEEDRMPPWKPHPGAGVFLDAPRLSRGRERDTQALGIDGMRDRAIRRIFPRFPRFATDGSSASPTWS